VGIDDIQFAHLSLSGCPALLCCPSAHASDSNIASRGPDELIVPPDPAIATLGVLRIRRPDNLRGLLLAMLIEPTRYSRVGLLRHRTRDEDDNMIKVLSMMKRKEGTSLDEFRHWLTQEHVQFARKIPGLLKFVVNIPETDSPDNAFDAVNELYFDDEAAMQRAFASEEGKASGADALEHISARSRLITIEHRLID
jgi:uncharacterized protein (TIGR02118 family)